MSDGILLERVNANLNRLRLPRINALLPVMLETAQQKTWSYLSFLDILLDEEVCQKEQRRIEANLRISGLPFVKTIDEYEFTFQPNLDQRKINSLFDLTFIQQHQNVIFLGPPGVGKTHLAVALAVKACQSGISIYFTTMESLIRKLKKDQESVRQGKGRSYNKAALVIVDEVGYTPISREECHLFFRFVANRYEKNSTIITSNKAFADWTELFHDPIIVTAVLDRLLHHAVVVNIKGNSYRLKDKLGKEDNPDGSV